MRTRTIVFALLLIGSPALARGLHGGSALPSAPSTLPALTAVYNIGSTGSGQLVTLAQPFATGDVPTGNKVQVYKADGVTTIPTQQDCYSTWAQDNSAKSCAVSFVQPDSITGGASLNVKIGTVAGSPNTTPSVTKANITANTNICLKSTDLKEADGTAETGTWDLVCLNTVLNNYAQYNGTTGYGANPVGGWEYYASGPNRVGVHAFQYAIRESGGAIHRWLRTDMWVDFWGSGSTPCPCSVATTTSQPNSFGGISSGTVGATTQTGYVFSAQLLNGANVIYNYGGASDTRVLNLTSSNFTVATGIMAPTAGNWTEGTQGIFPVTFSSTGTLPTGLTSGAIYWIYVFNEVGTNSFKLFPAQCSTLGFGGNCYDTFFPTTSSVVQALRGVGNYLDINNGMNATTYVKFCPTSNCVATTGDVALSASSGNYIPIGAGNNYIAYISPSGTNGSAIALAYRQGFSTAGSGTITMTPYAPTNPWTGFMGLDMKSQRLWINSSGTAGVAPAILVGHDFTYLTQKTKATLPFITAGAGALLAITDTTNKYYAGSYYWQPDMNNTGDAPGDERIGYINHSGAYTLFNPADQNAYLKSMVLASSLGRYHMYHQDERVGLPDVMNNGPAKNGVTYASMGVVQPTTRMYPYSGGAWLTPSASTIDLDPYQERYGVWMDPSHLPVPQQSAFLKTGMPEWQDQMVMESNAMIGPMYVPTTTVGSNTYYRALGSVGNNQTRGNAWGERLLAQTAYFGHSIPSVLQYIKDLRDENDNYMWDYSQNGGTSQERVLGYLGNDTGLIISGQSTAFQQWMDDFVFMSYGMNAWRNENASARNFTNNAFYKFALGRMDATVGGCLWGGAGRLVSPFGATYTAGDLATTWNNYYAYSTSHIGTAGGYPSSWTSCPGSGLIADGNPTDGYGSFGNSPVSLITDQAGTAAIAALLGIANGATIYSALRNIQYNSLCVPCGPPGLSFTNYNDGHSTQSFPEWWFGPLGATQ